ncbi:MAG: N-6 DNA methylase, partial [Bacteroidales bacterium]|nr:N-6 DNA methylase [Bacteroidales bacterium]
ETEVDVNILGHIFEHSLSEIENVQAEIAGEEIDKQKTKRKKDGIFYTPKYITKYIVENTVGKLCEEKRTEFGIIDEEYAKGRRNRKKDIVRDLDNKLIKYREWLLEITILDPACGSGAFLNQALEFLINEHKKIDELKAQLLGGSIIFPDIEAKILEKNIYGVDLNEESVEIAKLSLWLRTAQKGRKLTTLSNHIKCGNSLIDDPEIAGEKAFKWKDEFSEVFEKGGFDVVIGNPPYVNSKDENFTDNIKAFLTEHYNTVIYQIDLYILFLEKSIQLQNSLGICSLIIPNAWLNNLFLKDVRKYILENSSLYQIISMPPNTFADANVDTVIVSFGKNERDNETELKACQNGEFFKLGAVVQNQWLLDDNYTINVHVTNEINQVLEKIKINSVSLHSFTEIARGVGVYHKRVGHTKELIAKDPFQSDKKEDDTFVPYLRGKNVNSWNINWNNDSFISYGKWLAEPREPKYFDGRRIVLRQIPSNRLIATYIQNKFK